MYPFEKVVTTEDEFREVMGHPGPRVIAKTSKSLEEHSKAFITKAPFLLISSSSGDGQITVSPKGDASGFVRVVDDKTLLIPERLGNKRAETFKNILEDPQVGLLFMVPTRGEVLRLSGRARIIQDSDWLSRFEVSGRSPNFALAIHVDELYFHCSKAVKRSNLWLHDEWLEANELASLGKIMVDMGKLNDSAAAMQAIVDEDEKTRLY